MKLERLETYALGQLGVGEDTLDGPFFMAGGSFGFLVSLRGKDGGAMPSARELHWRRDLPPPVRTGDIHLFFRRADEALYLGLARLRPREKAAARGGARHVFELSEPVDEPAWSDLVKAATAAPPPSPEEAIVALSRNGSTTAHRVLAMRSFAERWFGADPKAPACVLPAPAPAPAPLRELLGLVQGHEVCVQNRLLSPGELAMVDGKLVFYVENQGVCVWGTEATEGDGEDPPVHVRYDDGWKREADSLSGFLIQLLVHEAVMGAPFSASTEELDARALAALAKRVPALPISDWQSSRMRFFGGGGVIGIAYFEGADECLSSVRLGAKDRLPLEAIEDLVADWPNVGF